MHPDQLAKDRPVRVWVQGPRRGARQRGWIIATAPIAAWTIGRRGRAVVHRYRQQGGRVSWQQVPHRLSYAGHPLTGTAEELHAAVDQLDADTVPESYYQKVVASRTRPQ